MKAHNRKNNQRSLGSMEIISVDEAFVTMKAHDTYAKNLLNRL